MKFIRLLVAASAFAAVAVPEAAISHTKLVASNPAPNSTVSKPTRLTLNYSEKIIAPLTRVEISMTSMPGMAGHKPLKVTDFKTSVGSGDKTVVIIFPRPLPAGTYDLKWHAIGGDTHRIDGGFSFNVR